MTSTPDQLAARVFDLGDILSVTTGKLVSPRLIDGVCDLLRHMTGESPYTHQIGRFQAECRPHLLRQHPHLRAVDASGVTRETWLTWLHEQKTRFGATLTVMPIPQDDHARRDPLVELTEMVGPERIIVVDPDEL